MVIKYATQWDAHGLDGGNNMSETPFETIVRRDRKTGREREREIPETIYVTLSRDSVRFGDDN